MHHLSSLMLVPFAFSGLATVGAVWLVASPEGNALALGVLAICILAVTGLTHAVSVCWRTAAARNSKTHLRDKGDSCDGR